jgi:hypothetical protein
VSKQYWRLLEPGEFMLDRDEWLYPGPVWAPVCSPFIGDPVGVHAAMHVNIVRRRITLAEPQGWISVKERMPTKEDANKQGMVLWWDGHNAVSDRPWDAAHATHWKTLPDYPEPDKDADEEAFSEWWSENNLQNATLGVEEMERLMKHSFLAGRKSVVTEGGSK